MKNETTALLTKNTAKYTTLLCSETAKPGCEPNLEPEELTAKKLLRHGAAFSGTQVILN